MMHRSKQYIHRHRFLSGSRVGGKQSTLLANKTLNSASHTAALPSSYSPVPLALHDNTHTTCQTSTPHEPPSPLCLRTPRIHISLILPQFSNFPLLHNTASLLPSHHKPLLPTIQTSSHRTRHCTNPGQSTSSSVKLNSGRKHRPQCPT